MNLPLQNKVILIIAGDEDRDAAIIEQLRAQGALPCFILKDPVYCLKMVEEKIKHHGRIDGVINTLASDCYARLVVETVAPWLQASGGVVVHLSPNVLRQVQPIAQLAAFLLSPVAGGKLCL